MQQSNLIQCWAILDCTIQTTTCFALCVSPCLSCYHGDLFSTSLHILDLLLFFLHCFYVFAGIFSHLLNFQQSFGFAFSILISASPLYYCAMRHHHRWLQNHYRFFLLCVIMILISWLLALVDVFFECYLIFSRLHFMNWYSSIIGLRILETEFHLQVKNMEKLCYLAPAKCISTNKRQKFTGRFSWTNYASKSSVM